MADPEGREAPPTDAEEAISGLSPDQRRLRAARLGADAATGASRYPASGSQRRLWFLTQWDQDSSAYHVQQTWLLEGVPDRDALGRALDRVVERHEPLRTGFEVDEHGVYQVIADAAGVPFEWADTSTSPAARTEAEMMVAQHARRSFDLRRPPLIRALLVKIDARRYLLSLVLHHIACDAWSIGVLYTELGEMYRAAVRGGDPDLPELPVQYVDVTVAERGRGRDNEAVEFWREELRGIPQLALPADRQRPPEPSGRGDTSEVTLERGLVDQLRRFAAGEGCTLFMVLMAGLEVVLARHSGQEDFAVGCPVAGRTSTQTEQLIAPLFNILPIRSDCRADGTFRDLLRRVRERVLEVFARQDVPFDGLVDIAGVQRSPGIHPVFQVTFALQNVPTDILDLEGLRAQRVELSNGTSKLDLSFVLAENAQGMSGVVEWATD